MIITLTLSFSIITYRSAPSTALSAGASVHRGEGGVPVETLALVLRWASALPAAYRAAVGNLPLDVSEVTRRRGAEIEREAEGDLWGLAGAMGLDGLDLAPPDLSPLADLPVAASVVAAL